jgi:hypothetical protein
VPDAETARAIFLAVETARHPAANRSAYPQVKVEDRGDHWEVFRWRPPRTNRRGELIVEAGGGQLEMDIDKCSGAVSQVALGK